MPKAYVKKITPEHSKIKNIKILKIFGDYLDHYNLWGVTRSNISGAVAIGLFVAMIPVPFQMLISAFLSILFKKNLPIAVSLVWLTNPLTMPFIFYFEYYIGTIILNKSVLSNVEITIDWFSTNMENIVASLYTGSTLLSIIVSSMGYFLVSHLWIKKVKKKRRKK